MGGSSSKRIVPAEDVRKSISSDQMQHLNKVFAKIMRNDNLSHRMFRQTFLPPNTPTQFSQKLYDIFALEHSSKEMDKDDFLQVYYLVHSDLYMKNLKPKSVSVRRAILYFHIFKQHQSSKERTEPPKEPMQEFFNTNLFMVVGMRYFALSEEQMKEFLKTNGLNLNEKITLKTFIQLYEKNNKHVLFEWMQEFEDGDRGTMNAEIDHAWILSQTQKKTQQSKPIQQVGGDDSPLEDQFNEIQLTGLDPQEKKILEKFFNEKLVAKHDMKESLKELDLLFNGLNMPPLLQRKVNESFVLASETNYFEMKTFLDIMTILVKHSQDEQCLTSYIFDIFSKYKDTIQKEQLMQVVEIFSDMPEFTIKDDIAKVESLKKPEFMQLCEKLNMRFHIFQKFQTLFVVEFGFKPASPELELEIIRCCLDNETNLKQFMQNSLQYASEGDSYYLLNKKFWLIWSAYAGLKEKDAFGLVRQSSSLSAEQIVRSPKPVAIRNEQLKKTPSSTQINPSLVYSKDYVVVPPRVWKAFVNWYGKSTEFMREVICFPKDEQLLRSTVTDADDMFDDSQHSLVQQGYDQLMYHDEVSNWITELEIEYINLKCGRIQENGQVPTQLKNWYFSRKATLKVVLATLVNDFKNKQEFRLWDGTAPLQGSLEEDPLQHTIEQIGLKGGQQIFVEFKLESGEWPSGNISTKKARKVQRTKGCKNFGNTCYMNASLQCITNAPFMQEFFTKVAEDEKWPPYRKQMNPKNFMGNNGRFVKPYAELVDKMWSSSGMLPVFPYNFKTGLDTVNPDFRGNRQHDAHEFINVALGALHEELSLRTKKPYIAKPEFRPDTIELSYEFWSNFLRRDWSFLVFLFYGQIKSTIECQNCLTTRVSYDPFSNISLPVPNSNSINLPIIVNSLPTELYSILRDELMLGGANFCTQQAKEQLQKRSSAIIENIDEFRTKQKRQSSIYVQVMIDQGQTVEQLINELRSMNGLNLVGKVDINGKKIELTKLIIYDLKESRKSAINLVLQDFKTLEQMGVMDKQTLVATEVLTEDAKNMIQQHYASQIADGGDQKKDTQLLRTLRSLDNFQVLNKTKEEQKQINSATDASDIIPSQAYFNKVARVPNFRLQPNQSPPPEVLIMIHNRKLILRDPSSRLINRLEPTFFGAEFPILVTKSTNGRELYEQVWLRVRSMLQLSVHERSQLWWNQCTSTNDLNQNESTFSPFVLKHVDMSGQFCSICHWSKKCYGCLIQPSETDAEALRPILLNNNFIACDWNIDFFNEHNDPQSINYQEHESVKQVKHELEREVKFSDCMELFQKDDQIESKCENCNKSSMMTKHLQIQGSPPVLVIHLKRFKVTTHQTTKMQSLIQFPIYDFDLGEYVPFKQPGMTYKYDLFGIVNHYGGMTFGHYISFVKNENTGEWLKYDDSTCSSLTEEQVQTSAAYILFYKRKDIIGKSMSEVIPTLNKTKFPGMPVRMKSGNVGYFIEYREGHPCPFLIGLGSSVRLYLSSSSIVEDDDMWPGDNSKAQPTQKLVTTAGTRNVYPPQQMEMKKIPKISGRIPGLVEQDMGCTPF